LYLRAPQKINDEKPKLNIPEGEKFDFDLPLELNLKKSSDLKDNDERLD